MEVLLMLPQTIHLLLNTNQVFFKTLTDGDNGVFAGVKIVVPLKYLSSFLGH